MKLQVEGVSELVLQVQEMERAVDFWSNKLGFPIVDQWSYKNGQFDASGIGGIYATWLYVGGNTRLGLWLPRNFSKKQLDIKQGPISQWNDGLYDEGGIHVHFALYIKPELFDDTIKLLKSMDIDFLVFSKENPEASNLYFKDTEGNVVEFYTKNMLKTYGNQNKSEPELSYRRKTRVSKPATRSCRENVWQLCCVNGQECSIKQFMVKWKKIKSGCFLERIALAKAIYETAHLTGEFKLRSGQISNQYFDKYLFESNPILLNEIAEHLSKLIPSNTEILAGLEMGGIPIATALSLKTGIPVVFVRKKAKEYGTCKLAEGIDIKGKNVCIIEDVVTTGGQILLSANDLKNFGANVSNVLCVIERDKQGRDNLEDAGLEFFSLFKMDELLTASTK